MQNDNDSLVYRVAYSALNGRLYAGVIRPDNGKWEGRACDVTEQAVSAVGQKLAREGGVLRIPLSDGRVMRLSAYMTDGDTGEDNDAQG